MGRPSKLTTESSGRLQRGLRTANGSGSSRMMSHDDDDDDDQLRHGPALESALQGGAKEFVPQQYLARNHCAKEEPFTWGEWPMDQTIVGHAAHLDAVGNMGRVGGGGGGQMTAGVCDFLVDSPSVDRIGMEDYGSSHPVGRLLAAPFSGGEQTSSSSCLSQISSSNSISLGPVHYGNSRWNKLSADAAAAAVVSKQGTSTVQPVLLNSLYHNSGGSVRQMNSSISPYEPLTSSGGGQGPVLNHAVSKAYHDSKANIPVAVNGNVSPELIQFSTDAVGMRQSVKLGQLDPLLHHHHQQLKLEHFIPSQSLNSLKSGEGGGQIQNFGDMLESFLLDGSCQSQSQERVLGHGKYDVGSNYVGMTTATDQQQNPQTNGDCTFAGARLVPGNGNNVSRSISVASQLERRNHTASCARAANVSPSSIGFGQQQQQQQQRSDAYLDFDASVASAEPKATEQQQQRCAASSSPPDLSPISTGSARDDAVVPMLQMSAETKNSMDSIAEWVFQLQQSYVDGNEEEAAPAAAAALSEDLAEVCRGLYVDGVPFEQQIERSTQYWKKQELPDENIMVGAEHWRLFNHFHPLYANYVSMGSTWNHSIRIKFEVYLFIFAVNEC